MLCDVIIGICASQKCVQPFTEVVCIYFIVVCLSSLKCCVPLFTEVLCASLH